jgi:hypothetical protein
VHAADFATRNIGVASLRDATTYARSPLEGVIAFGWRRLTRRMGSPGIAAWIAHLAFWILAIYGWFWDELTPKGLGLFVLLWLAGMFGLPLIPHGTALFPPFAAVLDIALVFIIFKGDVRL